VTLSINHHVGDTQALAPALNLRDDLIHGANERARRPQQRRDIGVRAAEVVGPALGDQLRTASAIRGGRRVVAWRQPEAAGHTTGPRPTSKPASVWRPSARNVAWLLLKPEKDRSAEQEVFLAALHQRWPELSENVALVQEFGRVLSGRDPADLEAWVELTHEPAVVPELKRFAEGLKQDWAAVVEAVRQSWSNGQVEGQVNRLKLIKRQMYGRANFDLLRARVLHVG